MRVNSLRYFLLLLGAAALGTFSLSCQPTPGNVNANINANTAVSNTVSNLSNANLTTSTSTGPGIDAREPEQYQATMKFSLEALGDQQKTALPPVVANVARSGDNRVMEFNLPTGEKVVILDKGGSHYVILPNRKQYAEINRDTVGVDVNRLMTPGMLVDQVKKLQGVQRVGDETLNGRTIEKYSYSGAANTQTQPGEVDTQAYVLVDKETGLPLRSEVVSQSQSGGNVQGYKGMRFVTEMSDIKSTPDMSLFDVPAGYSKIDPEQVKAQINLVIQAVATLAGQAMQQQQQQQQAANANSAAPANR